ncbi:hypothetical protein AAF712_014648 [Marasmius tenuissimus]|uniref:Uncharacterized protein n=1 Tax=Marasmius tenuissimus TaxID=585030 RepID=A0ABR2ZAJ5_9AGAR
MNPNGKRSLLILSCSVWLRQVVSFEVETPLPDTVTLSQPFIFTWCRDTSDQPSAYLQFGAFYPGSSVTGQIFNAGENTRGAYTMTPTIAGEFDLRGRTGYSSDSAELQENVFLLPHKIFVQAANGPVAYPTHPIPTQTTPLTATKTETSGAEETRTQTQTQTTGASAPTNTDGAKNGNMNTSTPLPAGLQPTSLSPSTAGSGDPTLSISHTAAAQELGASGQGAGTGTESQASSPTDPTNPTSGVDTPWVPSGTGVIERFGTGTDGAPAPPTSTDGSGSDPTSSNHTGAIVGGVIAAIVAISILVALFLCLRRGKQRKRRSRIDSIVRPLSPSDYPNITQKSRLMSSSRSAAPLSQEETDHKARIDELVQCLDESSSVDQPDHSGQEEIPPHFRARFQEMAQRVARLEAEIESTAPPTYASDAGTPSGSLREA